jgi:adenylate cyclase
MRFRPSEKTLSLLVSAGILSLAAVSGIFSGIDRAVYDAFARTSVRAGIHSSDIVLIPVDQETIKRYGSESFWTRTRYKALLDRLETAGVKAVYFDYYFAEKTRPENVDWDLVQVSGNLSDQTLDDTFVNYSKTVKSPEFISEIDYDFARALKKYGNVFLPKLLKGSGSGTVAEPLSIFSQNAKTGFVNRPLDPDGVERRSYARLGKDVSIPALLAGAIAGKPANPDLSVNGTYRPNFPEGPYSDFFPKIPFEYAYNGKMTDRVGNPVDLSGKLAIVGDYAEVSGDLHAVPTGGTRLMSGMEVIASDTQSLVDETTRYEPKPWVRIIVFLAAVATAIAIFSTIASPVLAGSVAALGVILAFAFSYFAFARLGFWIPPVGYALSVIFPFAGWGYATYRQNVRDREKVRKIFSRYVSPQVVDTLVAAGETPDLEGEKRVVSVLFADVQGFTTLSENLSPKETVSRLNRVFSEVNRTVFERGGTMAKYIGDAAMAFWGAPTRQEDHAVRAVRTALEISERTKKADPALRLRIGIATGEVMVGNVGDERFSDYTVMGDRVNFASRLEGITRQYGTDILVSKETYDLAKKTFLFREVDTVRVKGKKKAEAIYEPLRLRNGSDHGEEELAERHEKALALYRKGHFEAAAKAFEFNSLNGDRVAEVFLKRITDWEGIPPRNFDGTWSFETK